MPEIYETLWNDAVAAFEQGQPHIDPHLSHKATDPRRGVTLVFRPAPSVRDAVGAFLGRLAAVCPGQHIYRPEELHVTVLSIISGTEHWRREMERLDACRPLIRDVLDRHHSFKINFRGVTASPDSILIQGFPCGNILAAIRDDLRAAFTQNGFGDMLDRRYKISGARMTAVRFGKSCADLKPLLSFLKASREISFGEIDVTNLQLIFNDWYASAETVKVLEEYVLPK